MRHVVLTVLLAALILGGCTSGGDDSPSPPNRSTSTTSTTQPVPPDSGLRPVENRYGDGIAYVLGETAAQIICQALTPQEWSDILGGDVGRTIEPFGDCIVTSSTVTIELSMSTAVGSNRDGVDEETIAGHPAWVWIAGDRAAEGVVGLLPFVEGDTSPRYLPSLYVQATPIAHGSHDDLGGLVRAVSATLAPKLLHDGPKTPRWEEERLTVPYVRTEPVPGTALYDLPPTVQGLVLCTVMADLQAAEIRDSDLLVLGTGSCALPDAPRPYGWVMESSDAAGDGDLTVAGFPAGFTSLGIAIDLRTLPAISPNGEDRYIRLLLRSDADPAELRVWAEKVVGSLGDI